MEIVSIPLKGLLAHGDSKKNNRTITVGDIQVMSAGTGIYHSEMNGSKSEPVEFLQIWIIPKERNTHPLYQDYDIRGLLKKTNWPSYYHLTEVHLPNYCRTPGSRWVR